MKVGIDIAPQEFLKIERAMKAREAQLRDPIRAAGNLLRRTVRKQISVSRVSLPERPGSRRFIALHSAPGSPPLRGTGQLVNMQGAPRMTGVPGQSTSVTAGLELREYPSRPFLDRLIIINEYLLQRVMTLRLTPPPQFGKLVAVRPRTLDEAMRHRYKGRPVPLTASEATRLSWDTRRAKYGPSGRSR